ncbi:nucleotidyltransferase/DNA polymerase involved in DNA repair [Polaromonas sp. CG_9.5]|nr:nucleotidyltransferase/DNA polymerase involved in DNA repair [Polaromonas sp. CG_9.5]
MSNRVVSVLREFSPDIEVYSIDESFLRVETLVHLHGGATIMGQAMRCKIRRWTRLPVCAGFGSTKTLATSKPGPATGGTHRPHRPGFSV